MSCHLPAEVDGVIQCQSERLRNRGVAGVNPSLRAREGDMRCLHSSSEAGEKGANSFFLHHLFYLGPQRIG